MGAAGHVLRKGVDLGRKACRNDVVKRGGLVLDLEVVELGVVGNLYHGQGLGLVVANDGHGDLGSLDALFHKHPLPGGAGQLDGGRKLLAAVDAADAKAGAVAARLDKERQAQVLDDGVHLLLGEDGTGPHVKAARRADAR